jgi:phage terminase large subunit GpA-like protein
VRALLLELNVDRGKRDIVYWFDEIKTPGPGFCRLPSKDGHPINGYGDQYDEELKAEELIDTSRSGSRTKAWVKKSSRRNEALDVRVLAYGALQYSRFNLERLQRDLIRKDRGNKESPFGARQAGLPPGDTGIVQPNIRRLYREDRYAYGAWKTVRIPRSPHGFGAINQGLFDLF